MKNFNKLKKGALPILLFFSVLLLNMPGWAATATKIDDCATLTLTSSELDASGQYYLDVSGTINGRYYMAYLYMDNALFASSSSFWSNSYSATKGPFSGDHIFRLDMRGGTSHGICNSSLELTVKAVKDPVAMAGDLCSAIKELPDDSFKNNPSQRKNALCNKLDEVATLADYAANSDDPVIQGQFYVEAIEKLTHDIATKMDGHHGGKRQSDWITEADAQAVILPKVEELRDTLQDRL